ncbi:hypothetical protein HZA44_01630 [Candidatus Peregrinibacteria bacterium]|nr:hypothetical protein [Candidatus Peregrinibacteria bacterium]
MKKIKILSVALVGVLFLAACSKPAPKVETPTPKAPEQAMVSKSDVAPNPTPVPTEPESKPLPLPPSMPSPSSQATGVDACALFTRSMAESLIGKVTMGPIATSPDGGSSCFYVGENSAGATLIVKRAADMKSAQDAYAQGLAKFKAQAGVEPESVSGLGDEAFWLGGKQNALGVRIGQAWVVVGARNPKGDAKSAVRAVMEQVLGKL